ncbi:hypothetical protein [Moorena bouillonii]|uniref:Uncharacterized protein n=1 Tax=Moorena bouillonii PNG TaxID=568701 RepID=A0A1U7MZ06_9CYAN|nr:hypothetical protein [Moorena bouillonii]OLT58920.1 hypothetical protein BJP37_07565 [Moorena bouillonii PNG]
MFRSKVAISSVVLSLGVISLGIPQGKALADDNGPSGTNLRLRRVAPVTTQVTTGAKTLFAVVTNNGVLNRGFGAITANKVLTGRYEVFFKGDVRKCAYTATLGTTAFGTEPSGEVTVATRFGTTNGVWVATNDSTGKAVDRNFHLAVHCP